MDIPAEAKGTGAGVLKAPTSASEQPDKEESKQTKKVVFKASKKDLMME